MLKTHLFYILLLVGGVCGFKLWLQEHDARVQAENTIKQSEAKVATLQAQINAIPAQTAHQVQVITKVVHDAQTPAQVVAAIPSLTEVPLNARIIAGDSADVEVASQPLIQLIGELKTSQIQLGACQQTDGLKDQQITELQSTIKTLQKKPKLLTRVKHVAQAVGIGVGIGFILAVHK